jgi:hypothetical protein
MPDFKRILTPIAVAVMAAALSACMPQTLSSGGKAAADARTPVAADQGALSPDIRQILVAGGLDAANPSGPAEIPQKIGSTVPEQGSDRVITATAGMLPSSSVNGVQVAAAAAGTASSKMVGYPSGSVNVGEIDDVLPSISKFSPPPKSRPTVQPIFSRLPAAKQAAVASVKSAPVSVAPKVRRF